MAEPWVELNGRQFRHWVWSLADAEWSFVPTEDMEDEIYPMIDRVYQEPPPTGTSDDYAQYLMLPAVRAEWAWLFRRYPSQAPESYLHRTPTSK